MSIERDKNAKVIIIGNSPTILNDEFGSLIDSFDIVIRINRCLTKGFEKYIGSKTDIWATTKNYSAGKGRKFGYKETFIPDQYNEIKEIWKRAPATELENLPSRKPIYVMYKNDQFRKNIKGPLAHWQDAFDINKSTFKCKKLGNHELDTGLLTMLTAELFYSDITIHGFSFYGESDGLIQCYYRDSELKDGEHHEDSWWKDQIRTGFASDNNTNLKNRYVQKLIETGKFKILKEDKK